MTNHAVPQDFKNKTIAAFLRSVLPDASWRAVRKLIDEGAVRSGKRIMRDSAERLCGDEVISVAREQKNANKRKSAQSFMDAVTIVHCDRDIVVADKPSGITTMRHGYETQEFGEKACYLPDTLAQLLPYLILKKEKKKVRKGTLPPLKAVHRIDKDTSGLVVFARNSKAASSLGKQFKAHTIVRKYQAVVNGHISSQRIESTLVRDRGDGLRGSDPTDGLRAVTHITAIKQYPQHTLIECVLETGKTHQIRIHCAEKGHPLCGEKIYIKQFKKKLDDIGGAPRLALHAFLLGFVHPSSHEYVEFSSVFPPRPKAFC